MASQQLSRFASPYPSIELARESYYSYILEHDIYGDNHAFSINGQTGNVITRKQLRDGSLRLAYGLRNAHFVGLNPLNNGSTAMIISPTTDLYMIMEFAMVRMLPFYTMRALKPHR